MRRFRWMSLGLVTLTACMRQTSPQPDPLEARRVAGGLVLRSVDTLLPDPVALCLTPRFAAVDPTPDSARAARLGLRHAVRTGQSCPPTYGSPIQVVDSLGRVIDRRPAGYVDPYRVTFGRQVTDSTGRNVVEVGVEQGAVWLSFMCSVPGPRPRRATCTAGLNVSTQLEE